MEDAAAAVALEEIPTTEAAAVEVGEETEITAIKVTPTTYPRLTSREVVNN